MKDDTISRAAALSALADYIHNVDRVMGDGHLSADDCMDAARSVLGEDELPFAQPTDRNGQERTGTDLISRQAALNCVYGTSPNKIKGRIAELPPAQPVNIAKLQPNCNQVASDVIGRQAALDFACAMNACDEISDDAYQKLTVHFENMPSAQPGWIPVTERLPKDDGDYLVTKKSFGWNCKEYIEIDIARYENKDGWHKADTVLAWCELPKPWEGGQDGKAD